MHTMLSLFTCSLLVHGLLEFERCSQLSDRHWLNGYLALRVPSLLLLASSFRNCLNCVVLKCMFAWRTRYPMNKLGAH